MQKETKIWIVRHFNISAGQNWDESDEAEFSEKIVGYYSDEIKAWQAVARLKGLEGFRDYPDGFRVFDAILDQDLWRSGFVENP